MLRVDPQLLELSNLPGPFTVRDAERVGVSRWVVARLLRHRVIERVHRGLYLVVTPPPEQELAWQRANRQHLQRARQALLCHPGHALSHQSAALAYGWPVNLRPNAPVHLTALTVRPQSRRTSGLVLHHCDSTANEVRVRQGLVLLAPARTVADCLRHLPPASAVAIADGALRQKDATEREIRAALALQHHWRGRPSALACLPLLDGRRETWLESYSFVRLHGLGIDLPTPQVEVFDEYGRFLGRVDGAWLADGTVAECDGAGKYLLGADDAFGPDPELAARRVVAERARERDIEGTGLRLVRWSTPEITRDAPDVARRVIRMRSLGDPAGFTGRLRVGDTWLDAAAFARGA